MFSGIVKAGKRCFAGIFVSQGLTNYDKKEWNYAESQFRRALRIAPDHYQARYLLAEALCQCDRFQEAEDELTQAIKLRPKTDTAWRLRGLARIELKKEEEAIADCQKSVELKGDFSNYLSLGMAYTAAKKFVEAGEALGKAAKMDPKNAAVNESVGECMLEQGRLEEARDAFRAAVKADSRDGAAYAKLAEVTEKLGDFKEALVHYTRAGFLEPKNAKYRVDAARVAIADGDFSGAIISYQEAVKLDPENITALIALCQYAREINDLEKAHSYAERLIGAHPDEWQANLEMAITLSVEGKKSEAQGFLAKALKLDNDAVKGELAKKGINF